VSPLRVLLFLLVALPLPSLGQDIGTLTLREGALRLIRGSRVLQGAEGIRLRQGDILENGEGGFAQLELSGGTIAVLSGPSRLLLLSYGRGPESCELALLSGWLKAENPPGKLCRYLTPSIGVGTKDGTVLLHFGPDSAEVYLESGAGTVSEVNGQGSLGSPTNAKSGQFFVRRAGKFMTSAARPDSAFIGAMPIPFRDTLPPRISRFTKPVEPKPDHEVLYADVERWLTGPRAWRRGFVERFRARLQDDAFRQSIEEHLDALPEWDPILHPEKYKTEPSPTGKAESPQGRY
jgi:hypothetical protein